LKQEDTWKEGIILDMAKEILSLGSKARTIEEAVVQATEVVELMLDFSYVRGINVFIKIAKRAEANIDAMIAAQRSKKPDCGSTSMCDCK